MAILLYSSRNYFGTLYRNQFYTCFKLYDNSMNCSPKLVGNTQISLPYTSTPVVIRFTTLRIPLQTKCALFVNV